MRFLYIAAANNTTNGVGFYSTDEAAGRVTNRDIYVRKIIVGVPVGGGTITLFDSPVAYVNQTTEIAFKYTYPATLTSSKQYDYDTVFDFIDAPLQLNGGVVHVDQAMQVTIIWEPVDEAKQL